MTQEGLFALFLFLHVLGAIVAFGPALSFALFGPFAGREPQHANFTVRLQELLVKRLVIPIGLTLPITGAGMIWAGSIDLSARPNWWLGLAIVLYVIAMGYAIFVQTPNIARIIDLTKGGPPGGGPGGPPPSGAGAGAAGGPRPGAGGPPPHVAAAINRAKLGGMFLSAMIVIIVLLMTVKPRF